MTGLVSPPIGEALAGDHLQGGIGTLGVGQMAVVVAEIELANVALQVLLADVVIDADDAALQDGEVILDRVCVIERLADILFYRMIDRPVAFEL